MGRRKKKYKMPLHILQRYRNSNKHKCVHCQRVIKVGDWVATKRKTKGAVSKEKGITVLYHYKCAKKVNKI